MRVFNRNIELSAALRSEKALTGFVPTMGALHEGHISLVERCRRECSRVVVSVFVNPTQFNDPNDLRSYPRNLDADLRLLERAGADLVYAPSVEDVYPEPDTRQFEFGPVGKVMEGERRPGHFNGVAQVVSRLFAIVCPDRAYFGEKDFQQIAVIRALVHQLQIPVHIIPCPIVREADGLALSSRNVLLTAEHRAAAPRIYAALKEGVTYSSTRTVVQTEKFVKKLIDSNPLLKTDYFQIVDANTLLPLDRWREGVATRGCVAVQAGAVRLIDNMGGYGPYDK